LEGEDVYRKEYPQWDGGQAPDELKVEMEQKPNPRPEEGELDRECKA